MILEVGDVTWPDTLLLFRTFNGEPVQCVCGTPVTWVAHVNIPSVPLRTAMLHDVALPCGHIHKQPPETRVSPAVAAYMMLVGEPNGT